MIFYKFNATKYFTTPGGSRSRAHSYMAMVLTTWLIILVRYQLLIPYWAAQQGISAKWISEQKSGINCYNGSVWCWKGGIINYSLHVLPSLSLTLSHTQPHTPIPTYIYTHTHPHTFLHTHTHPLSLCCEDVDPRLKKRKKKKMESVSTNYFLKLPTSIQQFFPLILNQMKTLPISFFFEVYLLSLRFP